MPERFATVVSQEPSVASTGLRSFGRAPGRLAPSPYAIAMAMIAVKKS
jgi:hypothetical protein